MSKLCYKCKLEILDKDLKYGLHNGCFREWFGLDQPEDFKNVVSKTSSERSGEEFSSINTSFFLGKFRKYSAELGLHSYILKVQESEYSELPFIEYICNRIGKELELNISDFFIIDFGDSPVPTFVSRNFIKKERRENLLHIYRFLKKKEEFDCCNIIRIIAEQTGKMSEIDRFIELCLFDSLIGNHDRHGRNIGFIEKANSKELAPFYDNTSYIGIEEYNLLLADHDPRGKIATSETIEPTMKDYVKEFKLLNYKDKVISFCKRIDIKRIFSLIDESFMSDKRKVAFKKIVEKRFKELNDAI